MNNNKVLSVNCWEVEAFNFHSYTDQALKAAIDCTQLMDKIHNLGVFLLQDYKRSTALI